MLAILGCEPRPSPGPDAPRAPRAVDRDNAGDMVDSTDRCTVLRDGCPGTTDEDGCPDVTFDRHHACEPDATTVRLLADAAEEMRREARLTRLAIQGEDAAAICVRDRLVAGGVDEKRLELARGGEGDVSLTVRAWDGRECGAGNATPP